MKRLATSVANSATISFAVVIAAVWALGLYLLGYVTTLFLPFSPTYPYYDGLLAPLAPSWLARWGGFDGVHYITIIDHGYLGTGLIQAFFPVYPFLVRFLDIVHDPLLTGLAVSLICTLLSVALLVKLLQFELTSTSNAKLMRAGVVLALLTFPTAFFFLSLYTESLFLLLVLLSFYFIRTKQWVRAVVIAGVASGTRVVGAALFPALLVQAYFDHKTVRERTIRWRNWIITCISLGGLAFYMLYLQRVFHDPLYFFHVQAAFGGGRQQSFVLFPQVLFRYVKILLTVNPLSWQYYAYMQELLLTLEIGIVLFFATFRKLVPWSYLAFAWLGYLIPPLTGTFQSMPRYVLVLFPIYLIYARWFSKKPLPMSLLFLVHAILLIINVVLFFEGRWVA